MAVTSTPHQSQILFDFFHSPDILARTLHAMEYKVRQ